jgi:DNA (cytosine-5)-methyltransferase 1
LLATTSNTAEDLLGAVGVDIFAGGFSVGVSKHFNVLAHLEESNYGVRSFKLNFPHIPVCVGKDRWKPFIDDIRRYSDIPFMYANPPCATFSVAGSTMRSGGSAWRTDPRLHCWTRCFDAALYARPHIYACESVVRAYTAGREFMVGLQERALEAGYSVTHLLVDATWLGVPQRRKRYFFVMHDRKISWQAPNWSPPKTVGETLADVTHPGPVSPISDPLHLELVKKLEPGKALRPLWEQRMRDTVGPEAVWPRNQYGVAGRPRLFVHRVHGDRPMGTLTGDYFIHPTEDRFLGMNELKVLNGFPEDYAFEGRPGCWASLIARGVCPPVASWLAQNVKNTLLYGVPESGGVYEVDFREPPKHIT